MKKLGVLWVMSRELSNYQVKKDLYDNDEAEEDLKRWEQETE